MVCRERGGLSGIPSRGQTKKQTPEGGKKNYKLKRRAPSAGPYLGRLERSANSGVAKFSQARGPGKRGRQETQVFGTRQETRKRDSWATEHLPLAKKHPILPIQVEKANLKKFILVSGGTASDWGGKQLQHVPPLATSGLKENAASPK